MPPLSPDSLEFARTHIRSFWDSDFFPKPFEFQALWAFWPEVKAHLSAIDVDQLAVRPARSMVAPKPGGGYRVVHQLDPLGALIYTALGYLISPSVEQGRVPAQERVACSYRIAVNLRQGTFFQAGSGFRDFVARSRELAQAHPAVLVTDITDFYNQIYLHRLQNAIAAADPALDTLATSVELFITKMNNRVSRGVPVGPAASIVMAEAILMDVDRYIADQGFTHTRYVDDFHIFSDSEAGLEALLRSLVLYLHSNHRLTLSSHKTRLLHSADFIAQVLDDPEDRERDEIHRALERVRRVVRYDFIGADEPTAAVTNPDVQARTAGLQDLMQRVCDIQPLDLGLARHVLRRCRKLRLRAIVPLLLEHFDLFAPVINDVVLYLDAVTNPAFIDRYSDRLISISRESNALSTALVATWWFDYIVKHEALVQQPTVQDIVRLRGVFQSQAGMAITTRNVAWVRTYRDRLDDLGPWDRRQVLLASVVLAADERRPWMDNVQQNSADPLEKWVARWAASR